MKKQHFTLLAIVLCTFLSTKAQQPWRFHIAFEDGSGQHDTLWIVFDNNATVEGVDYQLGEGTPEYDPNAFNAFVYNMNFDTTKTVAFPYYMYPNIGLNNVFAINYTYPVIIRWDTALFHAPYLPTSPPMNIAIIEGGYQFKVLGYDPTAPYFHTTNMLTKDSVFCPEDTNGQTHVPLFGDLTFIFGYDPYLSVENFENNMVTIYPNPSLGATKINCKYLISSYSIINIDGGMVFSETFSCPRALSNYEIPCRKLCSGMYIIQLFTSSKQIFYEKFIIKK